MKQEQTRMRSNRVAWSTLTNFASQALKIISGLVILDEFRIQNSRTIQGLGFDFKEYTAAQERELGQNSDWGKQELTTMEREIEKRRERLASFPQWWWHGTRNPAGTTLRRTERTWLRELGWRKKKGKNRRMGVFIKQFIAAHFSCRNKKYVELIEFFLTDFNTATKSHCNKLFLPRDVSRRTCFHRKSLTFFLLNKFVDFGD